MSKTTFFKDLGKATNDLLTKDFPTESFGFEAESKAENDVKFKTTGTRKADGSVEATIEPTVGFKKQGASAKVTIKADKTYGLEVTHEDKIVDGVKFTLNGETKGEDSSAKLSLDYKNANFGTVSGYFLYPFSGTNQPKGAASFTSAYEGLSFGGQAEYQAGNKPGLQSYDVKAIYSGSSFKFGGYYNVKVAKKSTAGLQYHHNVRADTELVADVSVDAANIGGESPKIRFAALWRRDADTTIKAKVESDAKLSLSYQQKLSPNTTVIIGSESVLTEAKPSHKVGTTFKFSF